MNINVDILITQIINFLILFFIFKYFLWNKLAQQIEERKNLLEKLKNADIEYQNIIDSAKIEKDKIIKEWIEIKDKLIVEWKQLWDKLKEDILAQANRTADDIIEKAKSKASLLQKELEENFEKWVKNTTKVVLNKIFEENKELQDDYLKNLISKFKI